MNSFYSVSPKTADQKASQSLRITAGEDSSKERKTEFKLLKYLQVIIISFTIAIQTELGNNLSNAAFILFYLRIFLFITIHTIFIVIYFYLTMDIYYIYSGGK